jgi:hypothetical protein
VFPQAPSPMRVSLEEYKSLRRVDPIDTPLHHTLLWFASLPPEVQPFVLLRRYARVANLIAATWRHRTSFRPYIESLLIDTRGDRRGFPPAVRRELMTLERYYVREYSRRTP